jgi:putative chitinase
MIIETDKLKRILPKCKNPNDWAFELSVILPEKGFRTKEDWAMFLAQCGHESADFNVLVENLNYSQQGLRKVFPKYFPDDHTAWRYARQPEWIASRVYAGRMGNGSEQSKEGWKYRGRGIIQITGKNNYRACSLYLFGDTRLLDQPDILLQPTYAILSACWFWEVNKVSLHSKDIRKATRIINGGFNGLAHREAIYKQAMRVL